MERDLEGKVGGLTLGEESTGSGEQKNRAIWIYGRHGPFEVGGTPEQGGVVGTLCELILVGVDVRVEVIE